MSRVWLASQLALAWLPMWALFTLLMMSAHDAPFWPAAGRALQLIAAAAVLAWPVHRFTQRRPWPHPFDARFIALHLFAAALYSGAWIVLGSVIESVRIGRLVLNLGPGPGPLFVTGIWLYLMIAAVAYANEAAQRAARIESAASRAQLAMLRARVQPHFLFNALHTVVQLIAEDPKAAARAAEKLAGALRAAIDEVRDVVPLADEWTFVERFLSLEILRFGERLVIETRLDDQALDALLPSFALQTLVENAVRHGASPRVEPTRVTISARVSGDVLEVEVADNGAGAGAPTANGSGLKHLRERMRWLYGGRACLHAAPASPDGFVARLRIPQSAGG